MRRLALRRRGRAAAPLLCRWDLDKTYLRSEFDTLRQLIRTARERGRDKIEVPGVAEVMKALAAAAARHARPLETFFISASPPQIGQAIREKLELDGVPYDGIVFKDQLERLRRGKFRHLREHVGFKLTELMRGKLAARPQAREFLFGDDWESDALIYSLYADVLAGRITPERLARLLGRLGVDGEAIPEIRALAAQVPGSGVVQRILINLERHSPPGDFRLYGPRVVPTFNYFQTAVVLAADEALDPTDVATVGAVLVERSGYSPRRLENSLGDLVRRGVVTPTAAARAARTARETGLLPRGATSWRVWLRGVFARGRRRALKRTDAPVDYDAVLDAHRGARAGDASEAATP